MAMQEFNSSSNQTAFNIPVFLLLRRNEEIDDKTLIQQLKRRIAELESQMACLRLAQVRYVHTHTHTHTHTHEYLFFGCITLLLLTCLRAISEVSGGFFLLFRHRNCLQKCKFLWQWNWLSMERKQKNVHGKKTEKNNNNKKQGTPILVLNTSETVGMPWTP